MTLILTKKLAKTRPFLKRKGRGVIPKLDKQSSLRWQSRGHSSWVLDSEPEWPFFGVKSLIWSHLGLDLTQKTARIDRITPKTSRMSYSNPQNLDPGAFFNFFRFAIQNPGSGPSPLFIKDLRYLIFVGSNLDFYPIWAQIWAKP